VSPEGSGLDLSGLRRRLGPQTLAVVCVHLFGVPANVAEVLALAHEQGAFVVEDAAQALGNEAAGRRLGTLGDIGVFSFGRGKPLTLGSGGAVVTGSKEIARALEAQTTRLAPVGSGRDAAISLLYGLFFRPSLYWLPHWLPFLHLGETVFTLDINVAGMSEFAAALGAELLPRYEASRLERARRGAALAERLEGGRLLQPLGPLGAGNAYLRLPLLVEEGRRQELLARLARLGATGMYPLPLGELRGTANHLGPQAAESYPHARRLSRRLLTLPLHGLLLERDLQEIERTLHETPGAPVAETT
jgi:dTDP-4-amino-4,6-dideoxygalactose transaminase